MKLYMVISPQDDFYDEPETFEGVYTTPELAAHAAKLYGGAEVREILTDVIPEHPEGCYPYQVCIYRNGKSSVEPTNIKLFKDGDFWTEKGYAVESGLLQIFAENEEHAIQIARERGAKRIANGEWPPGWADRDLIPIGSKAEGPK